MKAVLVRLKFNMILYLSFQLFRRVAAALPGMEQQEPKRDTSILSSVNKYNSKKHQRLSPIHKVSFNSYALKLVPIFYYRDKTRVQMFYCLNHSQL